MSYGIKMFNMLGAMNLTDDSKTFRLYDTGEVLVPVRVDITPGNVVINITPIRYQCILDIMDIDSVMVTTVDQWSYSVFFPPDALDVNNCYSKIKIESWALTARWLRWRIWVHL